MRYDGHSTSSTRTQMMVLLSNFLVPELVLVITTQSPDYKVEKTPPEIVSWKCHCKKGNEKEGNY